MEINQYLTYLDELTHEERSVFFYRIVLKLPTEETAKRLRLSIRKTIRISKALDDQKKLLSIKQDLMDSFGVSNVL